MKSCIAGSLIALAFTSTSISAAQQDDSKPFPHIKVLQHQEIKMGNTVIYAGDYDTAADPGPQYFLQVKVDDDIFPTYPAFEGDVGTVQAAQDYPNTVRMFTYVIREVSSDGSANIDLVITRRDPIKHLDQSEHIPAKITIGQHSDVVTKSGSHVAILLQQDKN